MTEVNSNISAMDNTKSVNQNHIILGFFEFTNSPDTFTKEMNLQPLDTGVKGETYLFGSKKQIEKVHEYNMWTYETKTYSNDSISDQIVTFIEEIIEPRIDTIKRLTTNCKVQLRIVQYYYQGLQHWIIPKT
jgi:hypothetical protein